MDVETTMGAEEFFSLLGAAGHSCLPRVQPSFPLVSLVDADVICFLLDDMDRGLFWMIEVNMRNKKLQSSALYISEEEEEEGYPPKRGAAGTISLVPSLSPASSPLTWLRMPSQGNIVSLFFERSVTGFH
jgi:hypothetical protein